MTNFKQVNRNFTQISSRQKQFAETIQRVFRPVNNSIFPHQIVDSDCNIILFVGVFTILAATSYGFTVVFRIKEDGSN